MSKENQPIVPKSSCPEKYIRELDEKPKGKPEEGPRDIWGPPYQTIVFILHCDQEHLWGYNNRFRTTLIGFLSEQTGEQFLDEVRAKNPEKYKDYYLHPFTIRDLAIYVHGTKWDSADIFCPKEGVDNIKDMPVKRISFVDRRPNAQKEAAPEIAVSKTLTLLRFELVADQGLNMSSVTQFHKRESGATCAICGEVLSEEWGAETLLAKINPSEEKAVAEVLGQSGKPCSFQSPSSAERFAVLSSCERKECRDKLEAFGKTVRAHGGKISRSILGIEEAEEEKPDYYYKRDYLLTKRES